MRLKLLLPDVNPGTFVIPPHCPNAGCKGRRIYPRQAVEKKIVDAKHPQVQAWRYQCGECGYTCRVYPQGVSKQHISQRVSGLGVMLYIPATTFRMAWISPA